MITEFDTIQDLINLKTGNSLSVFEWGLCDLHYSMYPNYIQIVFDGLDYDNKLIQITFTNCKMTKCNVDSICKICITAITNDWKKIRFYGYFDEGFEIEYTGDIKIDLIDDYRVFE